MTRGAASPVLSPGLHAIFDSVYRDREDLFGARDAEIVPLTVQLRESSEVARARVTTARGVRHIFAKLLKARRPDDVGLVETRIRLRRDFEITKHVFEAMRSTEDLRAVEPLACYEELPGVVTTEAPGIPLDACIAREARWPAGVDRLGELERTLERAGRWVGAFQRVVPNPGPSRVDLDATRQYIDERLQKLVSIPRARFREEDRRAVLAGFDARAAAVTADELLEVSTHGDITPSNIVVAPRSVTVLDFGMTGRGSRYLDIARLFTQLGFYTAKPQYRPEVIERLQHATLSGFEPGLSATAPLFEICAVQHVVCHMLSHARQPGTFPRSVYSAHQTRLHRRWLLERSHGSGARHRASVPEAASESR